MPRQTNIIILNRRGAELDGVRKHYLLQLQLQLRHNLHLNPGLSSALVIQNMLRHNVFLELTRILTTRIAASPFTQSWNGL